MENSAGVVDLPEAWQSGQISYREAAGLVALGSSARMVLINPGGIELVARSDRSSELTQLLQVLPRSEWAFLQREDFRIQVLWGRSCSPQMIFVV